MLGLFSLFMCAPRSRGCLLGTADVITAGFLSVSGSGSSLENGPKYSELRFFKIFNIPRSALAGVSRCPFHKNPFPKIEN